MIGAHRRPWHAPAECGKRDLTRRAADAARTRVPLRLVVALLAALPLAAAGQQGVESSAAPAPAAPAPEEGRAGRGPWYMAFGLGIADGSLMRAEERSSFRDLIGPKPTRLALHAGGGATLSSRLLLGAELSLAGAEASAADPALGKITRSVSVTSLDAVVTFFPMGDGFLVRAGGGLSRLALRADGGVRLRETHLGPGVVGGAGYAFRAGKRFRVSLNLDVSRQWYRGAAAPSSSSLWELYAGLGWN